MTKAELIAELTEAYPHLVLKDLDGIVNAIFNQISTALARGDRVELRSFGVFTVRPRLARIARNPRTGEKVPMDQHVVPFFRAGKDLRTRVNRGHVFPFLTTGGREGSACKMDADRQIEVSDTDGAKSQGRNAFGH
jgi:integration host factor subunit beta